MFVLRERGSPLRPSSLKDGVLGEGTARTCVQGQQQMQRKAKPAKKLASRRHRPPLKVAQSSVRLAQSRQAAAPAKVRGKVGGKSSGGVTGGNPAIKVRSQGGRKHLKSRENKSAKEDAGQDIPINAGGNMDVEPRMATSECKTGASNIAKQQSTRAQTLLLLARARARAKDGVQNGTNNQMITTDASKNIKEQCNSTENRGGNNHQVSQIHGRNPSDTKKICKLDWDVWEDERLVQETATHAGIVNKVEPSFVPAPVSYRANARWMATLRK